MVSAEVKELSGEVRDIRSDLGKINMDLQMVMENFVDPSTYKHFLILNGQKLEADVAYAQIYGMAKKTLLIVDNYVDIKTLRYILIDIKTKSEKLYHCGASSKDAGNKITTIVQLDDIEVYRSMFEELYTRQEQHGG